MSLRLTVRIRSASKFKKSSRDVELRDSITFECRIPRGGIMEGVRIFPYIINRGGWNNQWREVNGGGVGKIKKIEKELFLTVH